ncbi:beta-glucoside-specific PTS transporter subunit IIABC [Priestia megaterium]|uniref:beta-glucoside-specific PTS transporter subunit IIABC n=1 Tax=Priestia megaterium TaxID=1404 RepID=UPI0021BF4FC1|nr:beta-glucoside-specific PTS transporter subunit IIABC [Priestia megaterium]MCT9852396.1 beta-glucoside-specific PTS transporter subunit IIABC [Priestia megaterium]MDF1964269.1 beta-glucoside-specific PTS transporter subunit IIABC [Priestia megaterium]
MNYHKLAKDILQFVGGDQNVSSLVHCATRLRFKLKDNKKANKAEIENLNGILSVVESGGQFQVVVGSHVANVYDEIMKIGNFGATPTSTKDSKGTLISIIFETVSRSFSPLVGAFAGAGMLKAVLTVLVTLGWLSQESGTYHILSAAGNAVFYFLPIMLGITLATKLGANSYVGGTIGAALLEPNLTGLLAEGKTSSFLSIPVVLMDYSSSVFPIFIAVIIYAALEKFLKKVIHKDVQMFLVPMLSLAIIVPLTVIAFGPFGVYVGNAIGSGISFLSDKSGILTGAVLGAAWTFLTIFGLHWALVPIILANIAAGGDPIFAMVASGVFAQMGVALGIFLKTKDKQVKALAGSTAVPGLLAGVTEPIIYGLILRFKRTVPYVAIAGAVGGAINGLLGVKGITFAFPSLLSISAFSPIGTYTLGVLAALVCGVLLTILFGFEDKKQQKVSSGQQEVNNKPENKPSLMKTTSIISPLIGDVKLLNQVNDQVFSSGALGKGIAIEPTTGKAFSPVNGVVSTLFPTGHAIGITSEEGIEILIHIGIDTVQLDGKYYEPQIKQGDQVTQGDLLVNFDIERIKEAGYQVTTPIIITNTVNYLDVIPTDAEHVTLDDSILTIVK